MSRIAAAPGAIANQASEVFGGLDVVVIDAGIRRDRYLVNMTEEEFDAVGDVRPKETLPLIAVPQRLSVMSMTLAGALRNLVNGCNSSSGLFAGPGPTNGGAAKSGFATMGQIAANELGQYGVISNCAAPTARSASASLPRASKTPCRYLSTGL